MKTTQNIKTTAVHHPVGRLCQTPIICSHGSVSRLQRVVRPPTGRWLQAIVPAILFLCGTAFAQNADSIADREVQRRQASIPAGEAALGRGKTAMRSKNYTVAYQEYKTAVGYLPDAVVSGRAHDDAAEGVCKSGTVLAEARIAQGDYAGAEAILNEIITRYDPNCRKAQEMLAHMRQPGYFNKSVDSGFINKVEEVKRLLAEADGLLSPEIVIASSTSTFLPSALGARCKSALVNRCSVVAASITQHTLTAALRQRQCPSGHARTENFSLATLLKRSGRALTMFCIRYVHRIGVSGRSHILESKEHRRY